MSQVAKKQKLDLPNAILFGTGEYTTGYVHGGQSKSDKSAGVVGLVFFDLRHRGLMGSRIGFCGTSGGKFPGMRKHLQANIGDRYSMSVDCETYPSDDCKRDVNAYKTALKSYKAGDIAVITTPDDTHFDITMACIEAGLHVMCTKPLVKTLAQHIEILAAARKHNVLVCVEYHKRYDPIYRDAVNRIQGLGDFGYFSSYMSQPKFQLQTFKSWAGKSSDISYYLNSHHIDIHEWALEGRAVVRRVNAMAANGVCKKEIGVDAEDTITVCAEWENIESKNKGIANYTSSWATPKTDVHSEQRFFYMGHKGQAKIDQCHRGFFLSTDEDGHASINPLYMRYTPDKKGNYDGQSGYGYKSFEVFIKAARECRDGAKPTEFDGDLPTAASTLLGTAILEAGRMSLDNEGASITIQYNANNEPCGLTKVTV